MGHCTIITTMLFLLQSSLFSIAILVGACKNKIPGAALKMWHGQLKTELLYLARHPQILDKAETTRDKPR